MGLSLCGRRTFIGLVQQSVISGHFVILQIAEQSVLAVGPAEGGLGMPYELMYGRAGFLWAALFVNKYVGEETIPWSVTVSLQLAFLCATLIPPVKNAMRKCMQASSARMRSSQHCY